MHLLRQFFLLLPVINQFLHGNVYTFFVYRYRRISCDIFSLLFLGATARHFGGKKWGPSMVKLTIFVTERNC